MSRCFDRLLSAVAIAAVSAFLVMAPLGASAGTNSLSTVFTITAESNGSSASFTVDPFTNTDLAVETDINDFVSSGVYNWSLVSGKSIDMVSGGKSLGKINMLDVGLDTDPIVSLRFSMDSTDSTTIWTISSATVPFDPIVNPIARATAAITVTSDETDAVFAGQFGVSSPKAYQAMYNGGTVFANLVDPITAPGGVNSLTGSERSPLGGWTTISGSVDSIQSQFSFTLTEGSSASGTSKFEVVPVPEPGSLAALGMGLIGMAGFYAKSRKK